MGKLVRLLSVCISEGISFATMTVMVAPSSERNDSYLAAEADLGAVPVDAPARARRL